MTKQELKWFNALHEDRVQVTSMMLRPEFIHMFNEAIDKYSESAHFIYELLQNADDAGASKAEVILEADKLIFKHNGNVRFTISDPSLPAEEARSKGVYGHINSITALGFSTKNKETGEGRLMFDTNDCQAYTCDKLEAHMLGGERMIESSTFITSHQSTNVYAECEDKYEIRIDENALDIQINE